MRHNVIFRINDKFRQQESLGWDKNVSINDCAQLRLQKTKKIIVDCIWSQAAAEAPEVQVPFFS